MAVSLEKLFLNLFPRRSIGGGGETGSEFPLPNILFDILWKVHFEPAVYGCDIFFVLYTYSRRDFFMFQTCLLEV